MKLMNEINNRFSPYEFTNKPIKEEDLLTLFKAAGKAASAFNEQPWRFIYALKEDTENFNLLHNCLVEGNKSWTENVAALAITVVSKNFERNKKLNILAEHDLGLAVGNLSVQAMNMGIFVHNMAGIQKDTINDLLELPNGYEPVTAIAFGYYEGESKTKPRKPLNEIVFKGKWNINQ